MLNFWMVEMRGIVVLQLQSVLRLSWLLTISDLITSYRLKIDIFTERVIWAKAKTCSFLHERCSYSHVTSSNRTQPSFKLMLTL